MENRSVLVCHYTSFETFKSIIQTKKLFLSDYRDMNDAKEFIHARDVVRGLFSEKFDSVAKKCFEAMNLSITSFELNMYFEKMLCFIFNPDLVPMYLFCSSLHKKDDNDGLLSMWRAYGKANEGIGIVLNLPLDPST